MASRKRTGKYEVDQKIETYIKKAISEGRVKVQYRGRGAEVLVDGEVYAKFGAAAAARRWIKEMKVH